MHSLLYNSSFMWLHNHQTAKKVFDCVAIWNSSYQVIELSFSRSFNWALSNFAFIPDFSLFFCVTSQRTYPSSEGVILGKIFYSLGPWFSPRHHLEPWSRDEFITWRLRRPIRGIPRRATLFLLWPHMDLDLCVALHYKTTSWVY